MKTTGFDCGALFHLAATSSCPKRLNTRREAFGRGVTCTVKYLVKAMLDERLRFWSFVYSYISFENPPVGGLQ
jgi:hypothetical protein